MDFKYVEVGGFKVKLFNKVCSGGCGCLFWGLENAKDVCQSCLAKTPAERAKSVVREPTLNQQNISIFGSDPVPLTQQQVVTEQKETSEKKLYAPDLYTVDLGEGRILTDLKKVDYELLTIFVNNNKPLDLNDLFSLYYSIPVDKQSDYSVEVLKEKRSSLITKMSRLRCLLEKAYGGLWFGQKKGYWQLQGTPENIEKVSTLKFLDATRKALPRAKPSASLVEKALDSLAGDSNDKLSNTLCSIKDTLLHTKVVSEDAKPVPTVEVKVIEEVKPVIKPTVEVKVIEDIKPVPTVEVKDTAVGSDEHWHRCIEKAKRIKDMVKNNRLILADIAIEACDIVWGGGAHWSNFSKQRTIIDFSKMIGINQKTMYEWIKVKTHVVNKLAPGDYSNPKLWKILRAVQDKVNKDTVPSVVQEIYLKELRREGPNAKIKHVLRVTKNVKHFVSKNDLSSIHKEDLDELKTTCEAITAKLGGVSLTPYL